MKSMTGFGRASAPLSAGNVVVQVNSVNRKTLDLSVRLPDAWSALEPKIAEAVREVASRGKVHVQIGLEAGGSSEAQVELSLARLRKVAEANGVALEPDGRLLWDMMNDRRATADPELDESVENAVLQAAVAERAPLVAPSYRDLLFKRLREAELELDLSDERVLKEIALFADRSDITEEITRLKSHLAQFESLLRTEGEIGRKGEFILQEIGREIHTIGSKANDLEIAKHVIELKNEMERVREQIANVE